MSKISELSDGGSLLASDYLLVVRSGGNVKVRMDQINVDQVDLGDNEFIRLGNSQDLTMVHTSTQSIINQAGIGDLLIQKAGATKLTINSTGIDVTGSVTADGLTVDGASSGSTVATFTSNALVNTPLLVFQRSGGAVAGKIAYDDTNTAITFGTTTNHEVRFLINNSEKMQLNSSGLDITGTVTADGLTVDGSVVIDAAVPSSQFKQSGTGKYLTGISAVPNGGVTGSVSGDWFGRTAGGKMFWSTDDGVTADMVLDASGNVGIGISPQSFTDLMVNTATGRNISIFDNAAGATIGGLTDAGASAPLRLAGSPLIFTGNGGSGTEAMRIDNSGNVGIGASVYEGSVTSNASSVWMNPAGYISCNINNDWGIGVNRTGEDGTLANFRRDGVDVGSIGSRGGVVSHIILDPRSGGAGLTAAGASLFPTNNAGAVSDGAIDLGYSVGGTNYRFKDLYLSGTAKSQAVELEDIKARDTSGLNLQTSDGQKRVILDNSGNLLVGKTSDVNTANGITLRPDGGARFTSAGTGAFVQLAFFRNGAAGEVGSISTTSSATSYVTSSDQRLKENIADADDAGSKIDAIQVRKFDWKVDGSHQDYGMVAQELQVVAPEAVSAPEDPEEMMGVDYSKLVPMMLKEIQSLRARINALEAE